MPPATFRAAEILDMAIEIERQGIAFYRACKEATDSPELKEVFQFLGDQEQHHLALFEKMKEDVGDFSLPEDFSGEYRGYTAAFVREKVFASPEKASQKAKSLPHPQAAVDWAIELEESTIDFYDFIKDKVRPSEEAQIENIIGEEHRHVERLNSLRKELANRRPSPRSS